MTDAPREDPPTGLDRFGEKVRTICDRFWLFTIAAISLSIVGVVVVAVVIKGSMPTGSEALLTTAVAGLLMIAQKVIDAQAQRRLADQLGESQPANRDTPTGQRGDPVHTVEEGAPAPARRR